MRANQTPGVYEFGATVGGAAALQFAVKRPGGILQCSVEAYDVATTISIQVSEDGTTWVATTVASNGIAVTSQQVVAGGVYNFSLRLRDNKDNYMRLVPAAGAGRGIMRVHGDGILDPQKL
jgi:hypothetical protein